MKRIYILVTLALLIISCSKTEKKVSLAESTPAIKELSEEVNITSTSVEEFERIKNINLSTAAPQSVLTQMMSSSMTFENFNVGNISGCKAAEKYEGRGMALKFPSEFEAKKHLLSLESYVQKQGFTFLERINYGDMGSIFKHHSQDKKVYFMQTENWLFIIDESWLTI